MLAALPFHETEQFVRLVQILRLPPRGRFAFLEPMQASGAPAPRDVIVLRCVTDRVRAGGAPGRVGGVQQGLHRPGCWTQLPRSQLWGRELRRPRCRCASAWQHAAPCRPTAAPPPTEPRLVGCPWPHPPSPRPRLRAPPLLPPPPPQSLLRFVCDMAQRQGDPRLAGRVALPFYAVLVCEYLGKVKGVDETLLT